MSNIIADPLTTYDYAEVGKCVEVLVIEHKHGSNMTAHASEAAAAEELGNYVRRYWSVDLGEVPTDDMEAAEVYFENNGDEFWTMTTVHVES